MPDGYSAPVITRRGRASASCEAGHAQPDFEPIAIVEVELAAPLPPIPAIDEQGTRYGNARIVVRLHFKPLGVVEVSLADGAGSPAAGAAAIWTELGGNINAHLRSDGLPEAQGLSERGLPPAAAPRCLARRTEGLRNAPRASVIICTRNRARLLARTLRSLEQLAYPAYEIIVVDGSRSSETADVVRDNFSGIRYFHLRTRQVRGAQRRHRGGTRDHRRVHRRRSLERQRSAVSDPS